MTGSYDAVIVGAGPNGLSAAVALAQAGLSTLVVEAHHRPGGGTRTEALTLPGYLHDVCSTVHPLGLASPWFKSLHLEQLGVEWIQSPTPLVHLLPDGMAIALERSVDATAAQLGVDGDAYRDLVTPFVDRFDSLLEMILAPLRFPREPLLYARFGLDAMRSLKGLALARFREHAAPALLAGIAAHAMVPLEQLATASFGLVLAIAGHAVGWPIARGGSRVITDALVAKLRSLGGELVLEQSVTSLDELPPARAYLLDVTPRQLLSIAGDRLPDPVLVVDATRRWSPRHVRILGRAQRDAPPVRPRALADGLTTSRRAGSHASSCPRRRCSPPRSSRGAPRRFASRASSRGRLRRSRATGSSRRGRMR